MSTNNDCPVCNGRKIILTRDYQDCERDEPCPHCSEHENCASCITLRAENARLREGLEKFQSWMKSPTQAGLKSLCLSIDAALKEPGEKPICGKCGGRGYLTTVPDLFMREDPYPCPECSPGDPKS